jgi:hypothetical protein
VGGDTNSTAGDAGEGVAGTGDSVLAGEPGVVTTGVAVTAGDTGVASSVDDEEEPASGQNVCWMTNESGRCSFVLPIPSGVLVEDDVPGDMDAA